nr:PREDICTED: aquaporin-11 [Lepisosteus oculatus]
MAYLSVSLLLLAATVLLSEVTRRTATRLLAGKDYAVYVVEIISTFQLCACTHELKLVGEVGRVEPQIGLTLTYLITVVHVLTFHGAFCNPSGALEQFYRGNLTEKSVVARIACQFLAASIARLLLPHIWSLGLSDWHLQHELSGFQCGSPIRDTLLKAAGVELCCAFVMQSTVTHLHKLDGKYHIHVIAAVITLLVYAGGHVSGAVFNPALAFSTCFHCSGNTLMEYAFVYWLGPVLGTASSVLLFDKVIPLLHGNGGTQKMMEFPRTQTKKIQ